MTRRALTAESQAEVSTAAIEHTAELLQALTAGYLEAIREAETQQTRAEHAEAALRSIVSLAPPPMPSPGMHELRYGAAFDQASAAVAGREMGRQDAAEIAREALTHSGNSTG